MLKGLQEAELRASKEEDAREEELRIEARRAPSSGSSLSFLALLLPCAYSAAAPTCHAML